MNEQQPNKKAYVISYKKASPSSVSNSACLSLSMPSLTNDKLVITALLNLFFAILLDDIPSPASRDRTATPSAQYDISSPLNDFLGSLRTVPRRQMCTWMPIDYSLVVRQGTVPPFSYWTRYIMSQNAYCCGNSSLVLNTFTIKTAKCSLFSNLFSTCEWMKSGKKRVYQALLFLCLSSVLLVWYGGCD